MVRMTQSGLSRTSRRFPARGLVATVLAAGGAALIFAGNELAADGGTSVADLSREPTARTTYVAGPATELKAAAPRAHPAAGVPTSLTVPRLAIDADVLPIQVEGGILEPPADAGDVGWDTATADAGAAYGGTVITGHTVHTGGGALDELDDLQHGDTVYVSTAKGRIRYVVTGVTRLSKQAMVKQIPRLFSGDVPGRLVLITCTDWNGSEYLANTVVLARPLGS
jgi:LPXTG-site transpeptidase (sortase) family protein